ncbi:hypothetical protein KIW84_025585 [Lathyrus oleraceus]|uniref:Bromo domain-containing protein n=1 Tax=Pisum sativum TaxID=3888 RepID=A0A9D4YN55_PEA|nr:hypothetical protein KIW84_025585 [Pisum sativum]
MDFGTMRAKLHEGMYKTLEEFEHDVFLIFNNAMEFNSSSTIYFRQARAISELANKVFEVLRINPSKFQIEFSEVSRVNERTVGVHSNNVSGSSHGTSSRKSVKINFHDTSKHNHAIDVEVGTAPKFDILQVNLALILMNSFHPKLSEIQLQSIKENRRYKSISFDRRSTYRKFPQDKYKPIFSSIYDDKVKFLEQVSEEENGYKDSLMLFCKDLGPTAQQIAKRKLLGCEIRTASSMSLSQNPKGKTNMEIYGESSNSGYSTKYIEYFNLYSYGSKEQVSVSNQDTCQVQNVKIQ